MEKAHEKVWSSCLAIIKDIVEWQHFKTWFEPIKAIKLDQNTLTIEVPSQFVYEWLEEHYIGLLRKTIKRELGPEGRLEYSILMENPGQNIKPYTVKLPGKSNSGLKNPSVPMPQQISGGIRNPFIIPGLKKIDIDSQLNSIYSFENLVEGDCNRLARSAGYAVAGAPHGRHLGDPQAS